MKRITAVFAVMLSLCISAQAKLDPSNLISDGMVMQQNADAKIWGTASPGSQITVTTSWNGSSYRARTDADGNWVVYAATPEASYKPYTMTIKGDGETIRIKDILIGEAVSYTHLTLPTMAVV